MNVMFWDLMLLGVFAVVFSIFLYVKRKKINREGLLLLYHTSWGIKLIDRFGKKHRKGLKILSYVSVFMGYVLMILMIYLFLEILWRYFFRPDIVRLIKVPPITPLIPYLPQIFKLDFFPNLYFSYWIIILAIVAITHEFFHGIFARIANVKTKTTGFGFFPFFLPVFLAAFVSLDEKALVKRKKFEQMAVLSAGTFANVITGIIALVIMSAFFLLSFSPAGVVYNDYAYGFVPLSSITLVNDVPVENLSYALLANLTTPREPNKIVAGNTMFYGIKGTVAGEEDFVALYYDAPAIKNNLRGVITSINGQKVENLEDISSITSSHNVGDRITISLYNGTGEYETEIELGESPEGNPWIGITFINQGSGLLGKIPGLTVQHFGGYLCSANSCSLGNFRGALFIYDLLWWLVLISFSIALVNMLPVGIFDGGRFFYLTILSLTKSESKAQKSYKAMTYIFLILLLALMIFWARSFF